MQREEVKLTRFNILNHEYVPEHEVITAEEVEELLATYNVRINQLPRIRISDPAIEVLNETALAKGAEEIKPKDVVKITRSSHSAGFSVSYRVVVSRGSK